MSNSAFDVSVQRLVKAGQKLQVALDNMVVHPEIDEVGSAQEQLDQAIADYESLK